MKYIIIFALALSSALAQKTATAPSFEAARKQPVRFTHVPILLLRFNPTEMLGYNNTFQFGAEIAPPIGKLSLAFDYGTGKGNLNLNKQVRDLQSTNKNREFRGEVKAYFSDWIPFYALDKKPFGRYYSLEYINGSYDRLLGVPVGGESSFVNNIVWKDVPTTEKTHVLHVKFGKHIHLHRHLFLDVYGGIGVGKSSFKQSDGTEIGGKELYSPVNLGILANKMYENPRSERYFFSKTFGVRVVVPI